MKQEILFILLKDFADWENSVGDKSSRCVMRWIHGIAQLQHR